MSENAHSYLPERDPRIEDYLSYDRVEVVHLRIKGKDGNSREGLIRNRLEKLRSGGIEVREVDIETDDGDLEGKNIAVAGVLGDVCVPKRRRFIIEHGGSATIDTALTSDY